MSRLGWQTASTADGSPHAHSLFAGTLSAMTKCTVREPTHPAHDWNADPIELYSSTLDVAGSTPVSRSHERKALIFKGSRMTNVAVVKPAVASSLEDLTKDYLASCRARGLAPSTIRTVYSYALDSVLLLRGAVHKIQSSDLLENPGKRRRSLSRHTVHQYVRVIRQFLKWCQKEGEDVHGNPQLPRLTQPIIDVLSREEIDQLEAAVPTKRYKLIIRLLADTGIRVGELCGLKTLWTVNRYALHKMGFCSRRYSR